MWLTVCYLLRLVTFYSSVEFAFVAEPPVTLVHFVGCSRRLVPSAPGRFCFHRRVCLIAGGRRNYSNNLKKKNQFKGGTWDKKEKIRRSRYVRVMDTISDA